MYLSRDLSSELLKWAQLAGISQDEGIREVIEFLPLMPDERRRSREAARLLQNLKAMAAAHGAEERPFLPQPEPEDLPGGELLVGHLPLLNGGPPTPLLIPKESLLTHMLVAGPTGKGKTMLLLNVLTQLIKE